MLIERGCPYFIVFEGIDGSGKTSQSKLLLNFLINEGFDSVWFREPSDSKWGAKIRNISHYKESIPIEEELNYFTRDREWDLENNIKPALQKNKIVILDRYFYSTACYQGARGLDMKKILHSSKSTFPTPDIIFLIDIEVKTAMSRIGKNREFTAKLFEKAEFLIKVRKNYLKLKETNLYKIKNNNKIEDTFARIKTILGF